MRRAFLGVSYQLADGCAAGIVPPAAGSVEMRKGFPQRRIGKTGIFSAFSQKSRVSGKIPLHFTIKKWYNTNERKPL